MMADSLISVDCFGAPDDESAAGIREAVRRMIAAFVFWLCEFDRFGPQQPSTRRRLMQSLAQSDQDPARIVEALADRLEVTDLAPAWAAFAARYLQPGLGMFGDDYFRRFVEDPGIDSFAAVHLLLRIESIAVAPGGKPVTTDHEADRSGAGGRRMPLCSI